MGRCQSPLDISFTTFEEFVSDRERFVERVVSLYGGSTAYFDKAAAITEHGGSTITAEGVRRRMADPAYAGSGRRDQLAHPR